MDVWAQAAQMNPDATEIIHNMALACEYAGRVDEAARYWQETVKRWKKTLELEPDNEYLKGCIIEVLREHGDHGPAEDGPARADEPHGAGEPHAAHRRGGSSIADYREILKLNPNDFEAQFKIANALMKEQKWDEASHELNDLRKKFPRNVEVLNLMGGALLNSGKVDEAFMVWKKALAIEPKNMQVTESLIKAHMTMGRMLREKGLYTPCLVHFKALTRYLPDSDEVHFEIGRTYQLKGDERSAYQEFQTVLKLNPKHKPARNALSSLKLRR
jgi:tetratricopeptide (TPR) repeat protein